MKFIVDAMLGRLAKWLRIMGYDTTYFHQVQDHDLVRMARAEERILLTRDRELTRRKGVTCLLIQSEKLEEQVAQLLREEGLNTDRAYSRCALCNALLLPVSKEQVSDRVPPYVLAQHVRFKLCPQCNKVYWRGTHWQRMQQRIEDIRRSRFTPW